MMLILEKESGAYLVSCCCDTERGKNDLKGRWVTGESSCLWVQLPTPHPSCAGHD